ncbi:hypothetical protein, partial [Streptomyces mirabilis]
EIGAGVSNFCIVFSCARSLFLTLETLRCFPCADNKPVAQNWHLRRWMPGNCCNGLEGNATTTTLIIAMGVM